MRTAFVSSSPSVSSHVSDSGARTSAHGVPAAAAAADNTDGPPIRRSRFVPGSSFDLLSEDLGAALRRFELEQTTAIKRIYTVHPSAAAPPADSDDESDDDSDAEDESDGHNPDYSSASLRSKSAAAASGGRARPRPRTPSHKHTGPSFDAKPDEEVFLMFFFVFNLDEFGKELENLVRAMEVIRREEGRIKRFRSLGVWSKCKEMLGWGDGERRAGMGRSARRAQGKKGWKRIGAWFPSLPTFSRSSGSFPNHRRHMENTAQTPIALTFAQRFQRFVWRLGEFLRLPDTKFAIKAGAGCAILASPAFMASTRPVFREYKGEWALVSFMVVLSPTVGQSNQMRLVRVRAIFLVRNYLTDSLSGPSLMGCAPMHSVHRALGTIVGAAAAYGIYTLFPDNNIALPSESLWLSLIPTTFHKKRGKKKAVVKLNPVSPPAVQLHFSINHSSSCGSIRTLLLPTLFQVHCGNTAVRFDRQVRVAYV